MDKNEVVHLVHSNFDFTYRNSKLKRKELKGVLLTLKLDKKPGDVEIEKAAKATYIRKTTQEVAAFTLGSVFAGLTPKNDILAKIAIRG